MVPKMKTYSDAVLVDAALRAVCCCCMVGITMVSVHGGPAGWPWEPGIN